MVFLYGCTKVKDTLTVKPDYTSPYDSMFRAYYKEPRTNGYCYSKIDFHHGKGSTTKSSYSFFQAFKSNDTVYLDFAFSNNSNIRLSVINNEYHCKLNYSTDIWSTYPDGGKEGTSISPRIVKKTLLLNRISYKVGDTIQGCFTCKTEPFAIFSNNNSDEYIINFYAVINNKELSDLERFY